MMMHNQLEPRFVKGIPRNLEPGILYVSMDYATVVHSCCCGCGHEVVTPLTPTDWRLIFNGETISLKPSVGNWNLPCRSHYFIEGNRVLEADSWDHDRIEAERKRDGLAKAKFYSEKSELIVHSKLPGTTLPLTNNVKEGVWMKLRQWFTGI